MTEGHETEGDVLREQFVTEFQRLLIEGADDGGQFADAALDLTTETLVEATHEAGEEIRRLGFQHEEDQGRIRILTAENERLRTELEYRKSEQRRAFVALGWCYDGGESA